MRKSFYIATSSFLLGVFFRSIFYINIFLLLEIIFIGTFIFLFCLLIEFDKVAKYILLFVLMFALGVVRTELACKDFEKGLIFKDGEKISFVGKITNEVEEKENYSVLHVLLQSDETKTMFKISVNKYPKFSYGELVEVAGVIKFPKNFETENGRVFDYKKFLMKDGIHYEIKYAKVKSLKIFKGNKIVSKLLFVKRKWLESVSRLLPEPESSLAGGVIVGAKSSLGEYWLDAFRKTGLVHIVVLSGYNLTLVANTVIRLTKFLPMMFGRAFGIVGVVAFAVLVGGGATVVRASIMAIIGMMVAFVDNPYILLRSLMFAGLLMVSWNPFVLVYDPGFQLSFLATFGLIFLSPVFEKKLMFVSEKFALREIVSSTFATQVFVFPLLMYKVGYISVVAPLVNILVLPVVPFAMLLGFVVGVFGIISFYFAVPFSFLAHLIFSYIFLVVGFFAKMPFSSVSLPNVKWWHVLFIYFAGMFFIFIKTKRTRKEII